MTEELEAGEFGYSGDPTSTVDTLFSQVAHRTRDPMDVLQPHKGNYFPKSTQDILVHGHGGRDSAMVLIKCLEMKSGVFSGASPRPRGSASRRVGEPISFCEAELTLLLFFWKRRESIMDC
jgi:hypothetical protein